jgi:hypothetical protein
MYVIFSNIVLLREVQLPALGGDAFVSRIRESKKPRGNTMTIKISPKELLRAKQLETLGIPLDEEVMERSQYAYQGLTLDQDPNPLQTTIWDSESGGTGIVIDLFVRNDSDQVIRLSAARLEIPWCNQIRWLEDPFRSAPHKYFYSFPNSDLQSYGRDTVLNHCFGRNSALFPRDPLDGLLLGIAAEPIPDKYRDGQLFEARLSIFDGRKNAYAINVKFLVSRDLKHRRQQKADMEMTPARPALAGGVLRAA